MKNNTTTTIWLKAAVLGSLWAASEIIFGSFFLILTLSRDNKQIISNIHF